MSTSWYLISASNLFYGSVMSILLHSMMLLVWINVMLRSNHLPDTLTYSFGHAARVQWSATLKLLRQHIQTCTIPMRDQFYFKKNHTATTVLELKAWLLSRYIQVRWNMVLTLLWLLPVCRKSDGWSLLAQVFLHTEQGRYCPWEGKKKKKKAMGLDGN